LNKLPAGLIHALSSSAFETPARRAGWQGRSMSDASEKHDEPHRPANMLEIDFALVVSRLIDSLDKDPARLRGTVYDLARSNLLDQLADFDGPERRRMVEALENAIRGVEAFSQRQLASLPAPTRREVALRKFDGGVDDDVGGQPDDAFDSAGAVSPHRRGSYGGEPDIRSPLKTVSEPTARAGANADDSSPTFVRVEVTRENQAFSPGRALAIIGTFAIVISGAIYLQRHPGPVYVVKEITRGWRFASLHHLNNPALQDVVAAAANGETTAEKSPLLPKNFGIYAVSRDQLLELEALPGRVPDQRVAISAAINTPSHTTLPDGKAHFIVYRRDSASNAPDRVEVRVIAKIANAMTFANGGKPTVAPTSDTWVIRNVSFGYRVAPLQEDPDMYEIRNNADDFALSPGRYALVVKGTAYDFTVEGQPTDPNQCLQRVEAANGSFYSPCNER
jgi:hypothetical protein